MNAMCRPCLYVVVVIGCGSFEVAEEKPSPKRSEYDEFIKYHTGKVEPEWFLDQRLGRRSCGAAETDRYRLRGR